MLRGNPEESAWARRQWQPWGPVNLRQEPERRRRISFPQPTAARATLLRRRRQPAPGDRPYLHHHARHGLPGHRRRRSRAHHELRNDHARRSRDEAPRPDAQRALQVPTAPPARPAQPTRPSCVSDVGTMNACISSHYAAAYNMPPATACQHSQFFGCNPAGARVRWWPVFLIVCFY